MKHSIISGTIGGLIAFLLLSQCDIAKADHHATAHLGLYTSASDPGDELYLKETDLGMILGFGGKYVLADMFVGFDHYSSMGADIRVGYPLGRFSFWGGLGRRQDNAKITDYSSSWDHTSKSLQETSNFWLIQIDHEVGLFFRYSHYTFKGEATFIRTDVIGTHPTGQPVYGVVDSLTKPVSEDISEWMFGWQYKF